MQFPESTQGFNRYAYVGNNPLSYNDPSGYFVVEVMAAGAAIASWAASSWYAAMIVGATVGYVTTGSLEGALFGAVSGLTAYGVGVLPGFNDPFTDTLWRAAMHGFVQGGIASAQHGSFRSGFLSAFTSKLLGPKEGSWNDFTGEMGGRVIQSAVIGGTASVIGGGKFANGAVTAAFVQLFNQEASAQRSSASVAFELTDPEALDFFAEALEARADEIQRFIDDRLPRGVSVRVSVHVDETVGAMSLHSVNELRVNPSAYSGHPVDLVASNIIHEISHINDAVRGRNIFTRGPEAWRSEVRAYSAELPFMRDVGLGINYRMEVMRHRQHYQNKLE